MQKCELSYTPSERQHGVSPIQKRQSGMQGNYSFYLLITWKQGPMKGGSNLQKGVRFDQFTLLFSKYPMKMKKWTPSGSTAGKFPACLSKKCNFMVLHTIMVLSFWTDMPGQTVQTQIRLLPTGAVWSGSTLFAIPSALFGLITLWPQFKF